jgi:hypothetical protein
MEMGKDRKFQQNPKWKIFVETQSDREKIASPDAPADRKAKLIDRQ